MKQAKLFTSQGDDRMVQWYKSNGFNPVALSANDIPAQLKLSTGMIDTAPSPPYPALMLQIFRDAKYMLDVRVAPLLGALVDDERRRGRRSARPIRRSSPTRRQAFERKRPRRRAEARRRLGRHDEDARADGHDDSTPRRSAEFHAAAEKLVATMRGGMVPADIYDMAVREREAFRKTKGK